MNKLYYILFAMLIAASAGAQYSGYKDSCIGDSIHISSYPYTISLSDTCYCIDDDDSSFGDNNAIILGSAHKVLITGRKRWNFDGWSKDTDLLPDSLSKLHFGSGSGDERWDGIFGIYSTNTSDNIKIKNLAVVHIGDVSGVDTSWNSCCIRTDNSHDSLWIESCYVSGSGFAGNGYNGSTVHYRGYGQGLHIHHSIIFSKALGYYDRMDYSGSAILIQPGQGDGRDSIYIWDSKVYGPGAGIAFMQRGRANLSLLNTTIMPDENNQLYPNNGYGTYAFTECAANSFCVDFWESGSGYIRNCSLLAGTDHYGCNGGILIEGCAPSVDTWAERLRIENNVAVLHHGFDSYYGAGIVAKFAKIRWQGSPNATNSFIDINNNDIYGYSHADTTSPWNGYGPKTALLYSYVGTNDPGDSVVFHNNFGRLITLDTSTYLSGQPAYMHPPRGVAYICVAGNENSHGVAYYNNHIELAGGAYIGIGDFDWVGSGFDMFHDDTVVILTDTGASSLAMNASVIVWTDPGNSGFNAVNNYLTDLYIESPHDTIWNRISWLGTNREMDFMIKRTFTVTALAGENPIEGLTITGINNYDSVVMNEATDAEGEAKEVLNIYYEEENRSSTDSTDYFPIIFSATYNGITLADTVLSGDGNTNSAELNFDPDTSIDIMYVHMSIGNGLLLAAYPYERGLKSILDSVGNAHDTAIWMWDYRCNTSPAVSYAGWKTARFDSANGTNAGWMLPQPYNDYYNWSNHTMPPESLLAFWQKTDSKDSIKGGLLLLDTVFDANAEPDSIVDITDFDMIMFAGNPFVLTDISASCQEGLTDANLVDFKADYLECRDSALVYPDKKFVYFTAVPVQYGSGYQTCMGEDDFDNMMDAIAWMTDTLLDLDSVPNFYVWDFFTPSSYTDPENESLGYRLDVYDNDAIHPNAAWYLEFKDSVAAWLTDVYWPEEEPEWNYPDTLVSFSVDSLHNDFSTETDSIQVSVTTGAESWCDAVIVAYGLTQPDSSADTIAITYSASSTDTGYFTFSITESDWLYVSYWVYDADSGWSTRQEDSIYFDGYVAPEFGDAEWELVCTETFDTAYTAENNTTFGTSNCFTYRLINGGSIEVDNGYATLTTAHFDEAALIRSTDTLPDQYKIRIKVGMIHYDLENYDDGDTLNPNFDDHNGLYENGVYFITVTDDTCAGVECSEYWWHYHRKMVIDVDNHINYGTEDTTNHPIFMVYMDPDTVDAEGAGNYLRTWDGAAWDSSAWNWNVAYTYDTLLWYYAEVEKWNDSVTLRLLDADGDTLVAPVSIHVDNIFGMGAQDTLGWLYIGEPHYDDYKGNVRFDEISLWRQAGSSATYMRIDGIQIQGVNLGGD